MRYRVDFGMKQEDGSLVETGYASYDESEYARALKLYQDRGIRLRRCKDIHDEGVVIEGAPIVEDLTRRSYEDN